jgi:hypothetical protein
MRTDGAPHAEVERSEPIIDPNGTLIAVIEI